MPPPTRPPTPGPAAEGAGDPCLRAVFDGLRFPAAHWQLLAWAEYYGAGGSLRARLWALPDRVFTDLTDVLAALPAHRRASTRRSRTRTRRSALAASPP